MALKTKYQKIDSNNIRRYLKNDILNKQDLQDQRSDYQTMLSLTNNQKTIIIDEFKLFTNISAFDAHFQAKYDEMDDLLNIFNNKTTPDTIDWIDI